MAISVGTFNLNNLFSRFNFQGNITDAPEGGGITLEFGNEQDYKARTFMGRLVKCKDHEDTLTIADRILSMNVDVLAVQEVEHIEILKEFNRDYLDGLYEHIALIEGNDRRMIDVGVLSKLPLGPITSHQAAVHPDEPEARVFSRDLLQVEILNARRSRKLFTLFNTHLKSHFVPYYQDQVAGAELANQRRQRQAETISRIISDAERPNSSFILLGDMNDPPESEYLQPMYEADGRALFNALLAPVETREAKAETAGQGPGPQSAAWTHRYNPPGPPLPEYRLLDQIWLSHQLKDKLLSSHINRRSKHGGDGSDHDPAWIVLDL
jgi:endonuclease/exonuclease/phosphatase family metal-dependent hydrolase